MTITLVRRLVPALAAAALAAAVLPTAAASAVPSGDVGAGRYAAVQAVVDYTVYIPTTTLGLPQTQFQKVPCGAGRDTGFSVDYGVEAAPGASWIGLSESPGKYGCVDGPDGVAPAGTFKVRGATAKVFGRCANLNRPCSTSTPALAGIDAYTIVTLPATGGHGTSTHVEVYTQQVSYDQIKRFVRGLVPVS